MPSDAPPSRRPPNNDGTDQRSTTIAQGSNRACIQRQIQRRSRGLPGTAPGPGPVDRPPARSLSIVRPTRGRPPANCNPIAVCLATHVQEKSKRKSSVSAVGKTTGLSREGRRFEPGGSPFSPRQPALWIVVGRTTLRRAVLHALEHNPPRRGRRRGHQPPSQDTPSSKRRSEEPRPAQPHLRTVPAGLTDAISSDSSPASADRPGRRWPRHVQADHRPEHAPQARLDGREPAGARPDHSPAAASPSRARPTAADRDPSPHAHLSQGQSAVPQAGIRLWRAQRGSDHSPAEAAGRTGLNEGRPGEGGQRSGQRSSARQRAGSISPGMAGQPPDVRSSAVGRTGAGMDDPRPPESLSRAKHCARDTTQTGSRRRGARPIAARPRSIPRVVRRTSTRSLVLVLVGPLRIKANTIVIGRTQPSCGRQSDH